MNEGPRWSSPLSVRPVTTRAEESLFIRLPFRIYRHDPHWSPPLLAEEKKAWKGSRNATLAERPFMRFLAFRGKTAVGRIAANIDPFFMQRERGAGFFGSFECEKDPAAAGCLLREAERFLWSRGAVRSVGPVNLSLHNETGCLTEGFEERQRVLSPHNPSYYCGLFEAAGYTGFRKYLAFLWTRDAVPSAILERAYAHAHARASRTGMVVRSADDRNWERDARLLHQLYNHCFQDVWGYTPISWQEFLERTRRFRTFYRPELVLIAETKGVPAGFGVLLPDINAVLQNLRGRLLPLGWLRAMFAAPRLRSGRFLLLGVRPDQAGQGVAVLIAREMEKRCRELQFRDVELSLIDAGNERIVRIIAESGCKRYKTFTLFQKLLT